MKCFVIFSLLMLGCCGSSLAAPKDVSRPKDAFTFPYKKTVLTRPGLRIYGGSVASPNQFPYQVGLYISKALEVVFCGGSLVSYNYVLTAANCVDGALSIQVVLGAHNISNSSESTRQTQSVSTYVVHPDFDSTTLANDIALLNLSVSVTVNQYVQIITMANGSDTYAGQQGTITGWGLTSDNQQVVTDDLRYASNLILSNAVCKLAEVDLADVIKDTNVCLSGFGSTGICNGDHGGPLVANGFLVGVTSFRFGSCGSPRPSVFSRVTELADWIKANSDVTS